MKKIYGLSVALLVLATFAVSITPVKANNSVNEEEDSFGYTCYSTFNSGTTNFTKCHGCAAKTGSNLADKSAC